MKSTETFTSLSPTPLPSIDYKAIERLERLIDDAESIEDLEKYKEEAQKYGLGGHYSARHQNFKK